MLLVDLTAQVRRREVCITYLLSNRNAMYLMEEADICGIIILKCILTKYIVR
jgi:hypothetical protein